MLVMLSCFDFFSESFAGYFHFVFCSKVNENIGDADFTSMYAAVDVGRADLIELLARYGGNVMATDMKSMTPLHDAARK